MQLSELTIEHAAEEMAGNWQDFHCFVWWREREIADAENWAIVYTSNRDSGLLDQSNAHVIAQALEKFTGAEDPDVVVESHSHWAVGHVDGFSIRVFRNGQITEAFKTYHELSERMDDYPILDESDYSERELDATFENLPLAAWRLKDQYELPDGWESEVYSWLSEHRCSALDNCDDQGGWPSEDDFEAAFDSLGYSRTA